MVPSTLYSDHIIRISHFFSILHSKIGNALLCICCGFNPDEVPASVVKKKKRRWMSRNKHLESLDQDWMVMIDIALLCSNKQLFSHLLLKDKSIPSMDEYMSNGYVSIALGPIVLPILYCVGSKLSKKILRTPELHTIYFKPN